MADNDSTTEANESVQVDPALLDIAVETEPVVVEIVPDDEADTAVEIAVERKYLMIHDASTDHGNFAAGTTVTEDDMPFEVISLLLASGHAVNPTEQAMPAPDVYGMSEKLAIVANAEGAAERWKIFHDNTSAVAATPDPSLTQPVDDPAADQRDAALAEAMKEGS